MKVIDESGKVAHEVIELQPLKDLMFNMSVEPLNVLSVCDSMGTLFIRLMNKGFRVKKYYSVELDPVSREVVAGICDVADVSLGHDVMEIMEAEIAELEHLHMVMATPECQPWGGPQEDPPGFVDGTKSDVFVKCCSVVDWCRKHHSGVKYCIETTAVSMIKGQTWQQDQMMEQEYLAGGEFTSRQASDGGARHSRTRRFFGNMSMVMACKDSGNPDDLLEDGWSSKQSPAPCIVASKETKWPVWVTDRRSKPTERQATCNELERFMGMGTGASTAFGKLELSEQKRRRLIGSAVCSTHYDMLLVSLKDFKKEPMERKMMALSVNEAHPDAFDKMLLEIVEIDSEDSLMLAFVDTMMNGWTPPDLDFETEGEAYHCPNPFPVEAAHESAVEAKMGQFCARNQFYLEKLDKMDPDCDYSPCFWKMKDESRIDPETGERECRLLCALMVVNSKTVCPKWMTEFAPNPTKYRAEFSVVDKYFCMIDERDAFQAVRASLRAQKHMKFVFKMKGLLYVLCALVAVQGLALSALFYCVWKMLILRRILGWHVERLYAIYMDDNTVKAPDLPRVKVRARLMLAIFKRAFITVSPKSLPLVFDTQVDAAGIRVTEHGLTCDDTLETVLNEVLTKASKGKLTKKQIKTLLGILGQALVGFSFGVTSLAKYATLVEPMHRCLRTDGAAWDDECRENCVELMNFIGILPRAFCNPDTLITDECCLIMAGDSGDCGGGTAGWIVQIADARHVQVPEDLMDPTISQLLYMDHSIHSAGDLKNLTYENELKQTVENLKKKGGMLIAAMAGRPTSGEDYVCKAMVYTDSLTAMGTRRKMVLPQGKVDYVTAKSRKLIAWGNDIAYVKHLPIEFAGIPGEENCLSDYLSHLADALVKQDRLARELEEAQAGDYKMMCPITRHMTAKSAAEPERWSKPNGWTVVDHAFTDDEWHVVCAAYLEDKDEYMKVKMCDTYKVMTGRGKEVETLSADRVNSWNGKIFAVTVCTDGTPALFVPRNMLRLDEDDEDDPVVCAELVLLVPNNAQVGVSTAKAVYHEDEVDAMEAWMKTDLRSDYILMAHDYSLHAKWAEMWMFIAERAYWPSMATDIKRHVLECGQCNLKCKAYRVAGYGLVSIVMYRHVAMDHKVCPPWLKALTGCEGILTIVDRASGELDMLSVETMTSLESGSSLLNGWIRHKGLMRTLATDQGSAFTAEVMQYLMDAYGVKVHWLSAVGDSVALGAAESLNTAASDVIFEMEQKGDVQSRVHMDIYLTFAVQKHNMITRRNGSTIFEMKHGRPSRTVCDLIAEPAEADTKHLQLPVRQHIALVRHRTEDLLEESRAVKDDIARRLAMTRDQLSAAQRTHDFGLCVKDEVSLINNTGTNDKVTVKELVGWEGAAPATAMVVMADGKEKHVKYSQLRPLVAQKCERSVLAAELVLLAVVGKLLLYQEDGEGMTFGGIITEVHPDGWIVHDHQPSESGRSWLPSWKKKAKKQLSKKVCPRSHTAVMVQVLTAEATMVGTLLETFFVDDRTFAQMTALGVV